MAADCTPTAAKDIALDDLRRAKKRVVGVIWDLDDAMKSHGLITMNQETAMALKDVMESTRDLITSAEKMVKEI